MSECALWYYRYHSPDYELCDDEAEAASMAVSIEEDGSGSVVGVQFPDGRLVKVGDWDAYRTEQDRRHQEWERAERERRAAPPRPTRMIKDPFSGIGTTLKVDADEPSWLGEP